MPIGVPRIIYCWGEELPAQWTDIYNFIFRRRMVFLMQYLDDELCNQICGLLINIHMEDRSKELEKKEMEKSGLFKSSTKSSSKTSGNVTQGADGGSPGAQARAKGLSTKYVEDLLIAEEDLAIDDNHMLEQHTLQKITMEWLNWNAQFFNYSDEPYLFYLAEILSKDFTKDNANLMYNSNTSNNSPKVNPPLSSKEAKVNRNEITKLMKMFKNVSSKTEPTRFDPSLGSSGVTAPLKANGAAYLDVYSPFRLLANFVPQNYSFKKLNPIAQSAESSKPNTLFNQFNNIKSQNENLKNMEHTSPTSKNEKSSSYAASLKNSNYTFEKLLHTLSEKQFSTGLNKHENVTKSAEKALGQRRLKRYYSEDKTLSSSSVAAKQSKRASEMKATNSKMGNVINSGAAKMNSLKPFNYLDYNSFSTMDPLNNKSLVRKQTERAIQEEESKKVFVIINSFGGSVGNGITVHDALQFIKAGSLTLALGVAASAASLVLAGGTIGERYVTEGCHVMIHQPEGGLNGQASDIWIDSQEIMKIRLDVAEIYSLSTYRPRHKILRDLDRDFYLTAMETIYYGLADEIATNEVMHDIIEMTSKVWDYHDTKQQRLLESRESASAGLDTQTQN